MDAGLNKKRILIFLAIAFGIPWMAAAILYLSPMMDQNPEQTQGLANTIAVSVPWLAALATRLITKEGWRNMWLRPNFRRGWRFYLAVWLLPFLAVGVGAAVFYLVFPQSFDPNLGEIMKLVEGDPKAVGMSPWSVFTSVTVLMMIVTVPINTVMSIGEEFGWRAYLLPKLVMYFTGSEPRTGSKEDPAQPVYSDAAGVRKAALLVGIIHGVWHWPLIIMAATFTPGFSIFTLLLYVLFTCNLSMLLSWATLRSGSMWPAAIGHGSANPTTALPKYMLKGPVIPLVGPEITGLLGGIGYLILGLVLFFSRKAFTGQQPARSEKVHAAARA